MTAFTEKSHIAAGPIVFAAVCGGMLATVLLPSPARIGLLDRVQPVAIGARIPLRMAAITQSEIDRANQKPLFNVGRKRDPPLASQNAFASLDTVKLTGLVAVGDTGVAIIENKQTRLTVTLKVGDSFDGRTVTKIAPDGVTFSSSAGYEFLNTPKVSGVSLSPHSKGESTQLTSSTLDNRGKEKQ